MLKVDSLTNWEEADGLQCFFTVESNQCQSNVTVTIYKRPDRVTLSSVSDVWVEGDQTELWCEIESVGPGHKLSVRWSRADPKHNNAFTQFSETTFPDLVNEMKNVSMTVNLTVTPRREDDGVQYQCAAVLNLDHHPLVFPSQPLNVTVHSCTDLVVTPASLLVEYGNPAEVNCSIPSKPETDYVLGWESKTSQPATDTETSVMWKVDSLTNWEEADGLQCYFTVGSTMCESNVTVTIYKRPDRVTLSSVSDVWVEGDQTELKCEIENVGPGHKLSVRWNRADPNQNNAFTQFSETTFPDLVNEMKNVSMTVNLTVTPRREDDGVQYQCAAVLNLDQDPLVFPSQPLTVTVHSELPFIWGAIAIVLILAVVSFECWIYFQYPHMGRATS
ncbi:hypothetical protein PHYPO_G00131000 [Pangasianodon hypophthalmus]|uniref:Ig-like domain-containing protein n=1 Tax=Pangasianodon hypophthalmus TaxID=310915 RepID=A0A5N5KJQ0_PANHP|nr:hypothetical protein PHYPO_G00131000 [Pangasianodon hypophthalmus]